jgi:aspartyl-tRNA(Asn)/glutamyl-tRNA(Gln) amidotransferase subunit A
MTDNSITELSAHEMSEKIRTKALSPVEVTQAHLDRIERLNDELVAFITVTADQALAAARTAEEEIAAGQYRGPLHGIPYGAKDIFDTAGIRTTHGASFYRDNIPSENAETIKRLEAAGAILIGKCNTHEFAAGSTTINEKFGTTRNPWNQERMVGGSSGGSAAALAARMIPIALGSDTGGSIRTPAALCGTVGLKPTHGRISLRGIYPNVPSFDHPGPMTRTVTDAALALQVMAGYDPLESKSQDVPVPDFTTGIDNGIKGARIAVSPDYTQNSEIDEDVAKAFDRAIEIMRDLGATVETVSFEGAERFADLFTRIAGPEFSEVHRDNYTEDPDAYDFEVAERVEWSLKVSLDDYIRALRERELMIRDTAGLLEGFDAMISPAVPCAAPIISTRMAQMNGREIPFKNLHRPFLSPHNITGFPALTMPMGFSTNGLPVSIQIASGHWREADVLKVARAYEAATPDIRDKRPPIG